MTMMDIAQAEAEKYEQLWSEVAEYRDYSPGLENFSRFVGVLKPPIHASLIDLGCGTGEAGLAFREIGLDVSWLASTWPRDHFCRSTIAPRRSWPTR